MAFEWINRHLVLMESVLLKYNGIEINDDTETVDIVEVKKPIEEYLSKFMKPVKIIDKDNIGNMCGICIDLCLVGERYHELECGHIYHESCINRWFEMNMDDLSCPRCRNSLYKD